MWPYYRREVAISAFAEGKKERNRCSKFTLWERWISQRCDYHAFHALSFTLHISLWITPLMGLMKCGLWQGEKKKTLGGKTTDIFLFLDAINNDLYSFWGDQQRETPAVQYSHIINRFSLTVWRWKTNPHVKQGNCKKKNINYTPAKSFCEMSKTSLVLSKSDLKWIYFSFSYWNS